jgi:hypothetical protein
MNMKKCTKKEKIAFIRNKLSTRVDWGYRALMRIYALQTLDEQICMDTKHENGVGFTGIDAELLTSFAKDYEYYGHLTKGQLRCLFNKIGKYSRQIYNLCDKEKLEQIMERERN